MSDYKGQAELTEQVELLEVLKLTTADKLSDYDREGLVDTVSHQLYQNIIDKDRILDQMMGYFEYEQPEIEVSLQRELEEEIGLAVWNLIHKQEPSEDTYKHKADLSDLELDFIHSTEAYFNANFEHQEALMETIHNIDQDKLAHMLNNAEAHVRIRKETQ